MTVKEKILLLLAAAIVMCVPINTSAQVTIGSAAAPNEFSVLELISNEKGGLRLPQMTTEQRDAMASKFGTLAKSEAMGLQIFNTSNYCVETWNGTKWISHCDDDEPSTILPPEVIFPEIAPGENNICLSGSICYDVAQTNGSGAGGDLASSAWRTSDFSETTRTYTLSGNVSDVEFYILYNNANDRFVKELAQTANIAMIIFDDKINQMISGKNESFTLLAQFTDNADGVRKQVSLPIVIQDDMCGVTLMMGTCSRTRFMPFNLGADPSLNLAQQAAYNSIRHPGVLPSTTPASNAAVFGDLYQWGRQTDGHEKRNSENFPTNNLAHENGQVSETELDDNGQIPPNHPAYGKFIKTQLGVPNWRVPREDRLWNTGTETHPVKHPNNDPCPDGWRVPTRAEWQALVSNNDRNSAALANGTQGLLFRIARSSTTGDGVISSVSVANATMFLPEAGHHHFTGELYDAHTRTYWSSTPDVSASVMFNTSVSVMGAGTDIRFLSVGQALAYSIRCIAE